MSEVQRKMGSNDDVKGEMGGTTEGAAEMPTNPEAAGKRGVHTSRAWMQEAASRNERRTNTAKREEASTDF